MKNEFTVSKEFYEKHIKPKGNVSWEKWKEKSYKAKIQILEERIEWLEGAISDIAKTIPPKNAK